ncbi:MAG: RsmB/NOP family class I SAM-dependent RNA methyltransferase, partial [Prosthecochloris sp.]|nr:RsmB/NOP family class I SAM-dependent RNA methyltransferase [Prosthecochloris sp.]
LSALTSNKSVITAVDSKSSKMDALKQRAIRTGCSNIQTLCMDLTSSKLDETYDKILLDAPCSGLGVLRRHPEAKWRLNKNDIKDLIEIQKNLLNNVSAMVKPGGVFVYTVCTFNPEETTEQIQQFLDTHPDFTIHTPPGSEQLSWDGLLDEQGFLRLYTHRHNCDGFFGARLRRVD